MTKQDVLDYAAELLDPATPEERKQEIFIEFEPALELIGRKFGKLTVVEYLKPKYACDCDCGSKKYFNHSSLVYGRHLTSGKTKSCGCHRTRYKVGEVIDNRFRLVSQGKGGWNIENMADKTMFFKSTKDIVKRKHNIGGLWDVPVHEGSSEDGY